MPEVGPTAVHSSCSLKACRAIAVPVHFWQGDSDPMVSLEQGTKMADAVPESYLVVRHGESHLGGFATAVDAVDAILGHWEA